MRNDDLDRDMNRLYIAVIGEWFFPSIARSLGKGRVDRPIPIFSLYTSRQ
jgi:hypothetical protein